MALREDIHNKSVFCLIGEFGGGVPEGAKIPGRSKSQEPTTVVFTVGGAVLSVSNDAGQKKRDPTLVSQCPFES